MHEESKRVFSYEDFESFLGSLGDGFIITDVLGNVVYMNEAAETIFDYKYAPGTPVPFGQICQLVNLETREKFFCPVGRAIMEDRTVGLSKNIGIMHDDVPVYLSATCSPRHDSQGNVIGSTSVFRDISRLQGMTRKIESDQYYMRSVFEVAKIGICSMNVYGEIVEVNEAALETMGRTYQDVLGNHFGAIFKCIHCRDNRCGRADKCKFCIVNNNIEAAVLDDSFSAEFITAIISSVTEEPIWLQFFLTQVWKENEKQIVLTMIDISRRKQREKELMESRRLAEIASNTKTQFLANMSHEIRTPINGMTGMIDLTLRTPLNDEQRENLQAAKQCSEDLLRIINDILDYAKLENGKMTIEAIDLDLHALLNRVCAVHSLTATGKGLEFNYPDCSRLPHFIKGDPLRLRQILHNLLSNAIKFTAHGSITLGVKVFRRGVKNLLEFYVEDTGIGIAAEAQEKLFKPFSQVDGSTTRNFGGTGLGLMIVKELVTAMEGEVHVLSRPGAGSRFSFSIPLIAAEKADTEMAEQSVVLNPYLHKDSDTKQDVQHTQSAVSKAADDSGAILVPSVPNTGAPDDDILDLLKYCEEKLKED